MNVIRLVLPVYYTFTYKTKKDRTILLSMNWYRNAFRYEQNKVKTWFGNLVATKILDEKNNFKQIKGQYKVFIVYHYKTVISDLSNVCSIISKFTLDALQKLEMIENDNVKFCIEEKYVVGKKTDYPSVLIEIIKEDT